MILVLQPIVIVDARTIPSDRRDSKRTVASFAAERDEVDPTRAQAPLLAAFDSASRPRVGAPWIRGESR